MYSCTGEVLQYRVFLLHTLRQQVNLALSVGDPYIIKVASPLTRCKRNKSMYSATCIIPFWLAAG